MGSSRMRWLKVVLKLAVVGFHSVTVSWKATARTEPSSENDRAEGFFCRKSPAISHVQASFFPEKFIKKKKKKKKKSTYGICN